MGRIRHKRKHTSNGRHRMYRTRRYQRDIDQIHKDIMIPESRKTLLFKKIDPDLPGLGQHYCIECSRYFETNNTLVKHRTGKLHKKRVKLLKEVPYSQEEAEAAVGIDIKNHIF
ncbi:hypothetical protein PNEG_03160 [Pneumocystis murina B123]|uniref:C2H2-type domain-containing protein n=1 Tax=Pneumocystis murina (strain B123) TaxID=1069680 RepID=M7PCZ6_PNEMU|nr:hypothetical protein PNEG_03160 [Pneumocystis murina B123]EMR08319.1 hypothetical protein PNEG_03160 [Pneumocystis murina B123]